MGDKLLAQRILTLLRETFGRTGYAAQTLLDWARDQREWLWPESDETLAIDWDSLPRLTAAIDVGGCTPAAPDGVEAIVRLLELDPFESELLRVATCLERIPAFGNLRMRLVGASLDLAMLAGRLAGADACDADGRVRRSAPVALGLLCISSQSGGGGTDLQLWWQLARILDECPKSDDRLVEALVGPRQEASLEPADFVEHGPAVDLLTRLLAGALERRAEGINVLIYGPPGTGKTELTRTLAASAGATLYAVGEVGEEGEEPSRYERLHALKRAQRLLARRGASLLLFDEMEDLFAEAGHSVSGGRRAGSKIFVNRMLETNKVPTIWTSNAIWDLDAAHIRRFSYVLRMDHPSPRARARIVARAAEAAGAAEAATGLGSLIARDCEAASVASAALRSASLAGGGAADAEAAGRSLLLGLRGGRALAPAPGGSGLDLELYESDPPIGPLVERLSAPGAPSDFSLLLTGPPGTGKTALAAFVAERLDRPLQVKRASDLLSKWVGGTEANIAEAFAQARDEGSVLLLDEVDSLLLDRTDARHSWEVTQVNELLTWMDSHPLPFIAATNWARRLDPAALRRFVFKIALDTLSAEAAARAWRRFFETAPPPELARTAGLTPGDFAVVARQLRYRPGAGPEAIMAMLAAEARARPEAACRIGF